MKEDTDTAKAILASAADLLGETTFDDIAYRQLGEAIGVSERTVYRHFPTRSHLLAALAGWVENQHFPVAAFTTWEQFEQAVAQRFSAFDALPSYAFLVARAGSISPVDHDHPSFFTRAVNALIEQVHPRLNTRDSRRTAAALFHFSSAQYWAHCHTGFGMHAGEITESFRALSEQVLEALPADPGTLRTLWPETSGDGVHWKSADQA